MSQPNEQDEISRALDTIFGQYFTPPAEMDLRGVDPATFALGICYGFDSWQHVRVVANNRRDVATAAGHWDENHPTVEFLRHAVGTDERALGHRQLLERAHPGCARCEAELLRLSAFNLDQVDPDALPDAIDIELWLEFQPQEVTRSQAEPEEISGSLHILGQPVDQSITAEHYGGLDWRITIRHPTARRATIWIKWTGNHITEHAMVFENDLADLDTEAPEPDAHPERVGVKITDPPEHS